MPTSFLSDDFLLTTPLARALYHGYAAQAPIFDFHNHLSARDIAENRTFENLTQVWLGGDHYKWRAMRTNGVDEKYCTGNAPDEEKFAQWAATVPMTVRNPLYVWTHLELKRYFGITDLLTPASAKRVYAQCSALLGTADFSARNLLQRMNVKVACTTDDPIDDLQHHRTIAKDRWDVRVYPTFRPDKAMQCSNPSAYNAYIDKLAEAAHTDITTFSALIDALRIRMVFFHANGSRVSDHALDVPAFEPVSTGGAMALFERIRSGTALDPRESNQLRTATLLELGRMYHERGWTMQLHIGALRNNNLRLFETLGPDVGCDSIGDAPVALPLSQFLGTLDAEQRLPRTILYNLNPRDNELLITMAGNFQDGSIPGKIQFGPGWWFLDQRDGMERQLNALSSLGLLSRFVGMTTDSRSFLSFPRHEYFRRILCRLIGEDVEKGEIPEDEGMLGQLVADVCFGNAERYFGLG